MSDLNLILGVVALISIAFSVWMAIRKPQEDIEKKQISDSKDIANKASLLAQKEMESKAILLAEQVKWEKEANEKKFIEFGLRLDNSIVVVQREIHDIDTKLQVFMESQNLRNEENSNNFTKLFTLLEERLPSIKK